MAKFPHRDRLSPDSQAFAETAAWTPTHYVPPSRCVAAIVIAALAFVATTGAVLALFASASATPWLSADQAALVAHCDSRRSTTQREACIQEAVARHQATKMASR